MNVDKLLPPMCILITASVAYLSSDYNNIFIYDNCNDDNTDNDNKKRFNRRNGLWGNGISQSYKEEQINKKIKKNINIRKSLEKDIKIKDGEILKLKKIIEENNKKKKEEQKLMKEILKIQKNYREIINFCDDNW